MAVVTSGPFGEHVGAGDADVGDERVPLQRRSVELQPRHVDRGHPRHGGELRGAAVVCAHLPGVYEGELHLHVLGSASAVAA
ncbi:MAG: hypothetical protein ACI9K2_006777 [Myxococcota bacterium]|jgi:hypothetical protein